MPVNVFNFQFTPVFVTNIIKFSNFNLKHEYPESEHTILCVYDIISQNTLQSIYLRKYVVRQYRRTSCVISSDTIVLTSATLVIIVDTFVLSNEKPCIVYRVSNDLLVSSHDFLVRSHDFFIVSHRFLVRSHNLLVFSDWISVQLDPKILGNGQKIMGNPVRPTCTTNGFGYLYVNHFLIVQCWGTVYTGLEPMTEIGQTKIRDIVEGKQRLINENV